MKRWLVQHAAALWRAVLCFPQAPLTRFLSCLAIGIALTLPTAGWLALENLRALGSTVSGGQQLSVFMTLDAGKRDLAEVESRLQTVGARAWRYVSREEALRRLQATEGMAEIVASLPGNPLPDAFVVEPTDTDPAGLERLAESFRGWPKVAHVQLDSAWSKRFDALLHMGKRIVSLLAGLFAAALVAVTFSTIRLQLFTQAAEMELARLIGATEAFIARPFLYVGTLQGALGGLFAVLLVAGGSELLREPVGALVKLYGGNFTLQGLVFHEMLALLGMGALLGWLGAFISLTVHRQRFD